jgi:2-octaprenyl-6-methoxyphenol hydroxylase
MGASTAEQFDVAIVGGGAAGLALAVALGRTFAGELRVAVLEQRPVRPTFPSPSGEVRASAVAAASRRLLEGLGVWLSLAPHAKEVSRIDITDSSLDDAWRPTLLSYEPRLADGEPAMHILEDGRLVAALDAAAHATPGVSVAYAARVRSYVAGQASATLALTDGRSLSARLVVAADGRGSALRELAGIATVGWRYGQTGIVTIVAHETPHAGRAVQHFLPAGPLALLPLTGDRTCVTWSEEASVAEAILAHDDAGFLAELERRVAGRLGALRLTGPRLGFPLSMHLARTYVAPRLALLGDAAHGVHPIAGQGLNLALRDVAALAEVVADTARLGGDIGAGTSLTRYERWRRSDAALSAAAFDGLDRLFSNDLALLRSLRGAGLGVVDRLVGLKQMLVAEAAGTTGELPRLARGEAL